MMDDNAVYLMLGAEIQGRQHMAIPVKNGLYDMIGYARQVEEAVKTYRKKKDSDTGDLSRQLFISARNHGMHR